LLVFLFFNLGILIQKFGFIVSYSVLSIISLLIVLISIIPIIQVQIITFLLFPFYKNFFYTFSYSYIFFIVDKNYIGRVFGLSQTFSGVFGILQELINYFIYNFLNGNLIYIQIIQFGLVSFSYFFIFHLFFEKYSIFSLYFILKSKIKKIL
jgi:hypothetical protein